ncbi:hypothetical protein R3P38DRAFT_609220 [Favolaschia claudopus]|uniref:Uncharacterized protein n=1 Tax=Favolaschia claudopus TaxID=2862362 RepID=A0AAW0C9A9_9AGAR
MFFSPSLQSVLGELCYDSRTTIPQKSCAKSVKMLKRSFQCTLRPSSTAKIRISPARCHAGRVPDSAFHRKGCGVYITQYYQERKAPRPRAARPHKSLSCASQTFPSSCFGSNLAVTPSSNLFEMLYFGCIVSADSRRSTARTDILGNQAEWVGTLSTPRQALLSPPIDSYAYCWSMHVHGNTLTSLLRCYSTSHPYPAVISQQLWVHNSTFNLLATVTFAPWTTRECIVSPAEYGLSSIRSNFTRLSITADNLHSQARVSAESKNSTRIPSTDRGNGIRTGRVIFCFIARYFRRTRSRSCVARRLVVFDGFAVGEYLLALSNSSRRRATSCSGVAGILLAIAVPRTVRSKSNHCPSRNRCTRIVSDSAYSLTGNK